MFKIIKEKQEQFEKQQEKQNEKEIQKQRQFLKEQVGIFAGKTNEEISQKKQAFYDKLIDFLEKKQYDFQDSEYFQVNWFSIKQEILKILDHYEILKNFKLDAWKWMEKIQAITKQINQVQKEKQRKLRLDLGEESSNFFTENFESKEDLKIKEIYEKQGFFGFSICKGSLEFKNQEIRKLFSSQVIGFQEVDQEFIEKEVIQNCRFDFSVFVLRGNFQEYIPINPDVEQQNKGNLYLKEFNRQIKIAEMQEGKLINVENFLEGKENLYQVVSLSEILVIFQLNQLKFLEILKSSYEWKEIKENIISFNKMRKKFFDERYRVNKQLLKREEESPVYRRKIEHLNSQSPLFKRNKQRVSAGFGGIQTPIINLQSFQQGIEDINKIEEEQKKQQQEQDRQKFVKLQKIQKNLHGVQRERGGYLGVLKSGEFGENNQNNQNQNKSMQSQSFFQAESQNSQKISEESKKRFQRNIIGSKIMQGKLDQSVNMEKIKNQINLSDYQNNIKSKNNCQNLTQKEIENGDQEQKSIQNFQDKIRSYSRKMSQNQVFSKVNIQQQFPFANQKFQHRNSSPFITNYQGENFLKKKMDFFLNNKQQQQKSFLAQNQQQQQKQKGNGKSLSFSNLFLTSQGNIKTEEEDGEKNAQIQNMSPLNKKSNIQYNRTSILEKREITEDSEENEKLEEISEIDKKFEKELIKENYKRKFQSVQISPLKINNQDFSKNQSIKFENKVKQFQQQQKQMSPLKQRKNQGQGEKIDPFKIPNAQSEYYMQDMDDLDEIKYRSVFSNISKYRLVYQFNPDVNMRENFDKIQQKLANNLKSLGKKKEENQEVSSLQKNKQEIQNENENQNENVNKNESKNQNNFENQIKRQNQQAQTNLAVFQMMCLDENNNIDYEQKQDNSSNNFQNSFQQSGYGRNFSENLNQNQQNLEKVLEQKQMKIDKKQIQIQNQSLNLNSQLGGISPEQRRNEQKRKEINTTEIKENNSFSDLINYHEIQNEDVNQECAQNQNQNQNQSYQNEEKNFNSQKILRPIFSLQNSPCNKNNENKINLKQQNSFNAPGKGFGLTLKRLNDYYKNQSQDQENTTR
ncbi:hypothetical protein PPERSA_12751 [Pseudocohnilembus persalinus]|uniref:Uncharacterized protein n=1 Tax=Pseudocohnilembus persalinus TaxID=266149 RepID=A0A0V0QUN6_PSEPJ|nr:hypothetical protein PPERSA_12751 [Pseudocohnilembus persalinus]|eukprot:KRX05573.1 hypothetical protein PPERSA_12751 [Pseudocohnilembus persalinus]